MWVRGALFALVLGGCYSPSFDTCSLVCAANEACPNGYDCSNGRCAIEGSTCTPGVIDGGDDGSIDTRQMNCGDGVSDPGDLCFEEPIKIDAMVANIADAQVVDGNGDGTPDIGFLAPTGYFFRLGGTTATASTPGPIVPTANVFAAKSGNANPLPELFNDNSTDDLIEVHEWGGAAWMRAATHATEGTPAQGIAVARTASAGVAPDSIAVVYVNRLRIFGLPGGNMLTPLTQSANAFQISGGRDVAIADTEGDNISEIAVARMGGVDIFKNTANSIVMFSSPNVGGTVDTIEKCNVDGGPDGEFVYAMRAQGATPGRLGTLRWMSSNNYEIPTVRSIPNMFGAVDCGDMDGDGLAEAIVAAENNQGDVVILVMRGRTDGTFEEPVVIPIDVPGVSTIRVGFLNADTVPDIIVTSGLTGFITVLLSKP